MPKLRALLESQRSSGHALNFNLKSEFPVFAARHAVQEYLHDLASTG
jgi:hypothetical protein